jgi:hypothetical protein
MTVNSLKRCRARRTMAGRASVGQPHPDGAQSDQIDCPGRSVRSKAQPLNQTGAERHRDPRTVAIVTITSA